MIDTPPVAPERRCIVIAEDDPGVRRSLQLLLHGRGYDVRAFASGQALLADTKTRHAACFIADYRLPDMDGLTLFRALKEDGWKGQAVLVTAFNSPELMKKALDDGFSAVIEKPMHERALVDAVTKLFCD